MYCSKCGKENKDDDMFCAKCGSGLTHDDSSPEQPLTEDQPPEPPEAGQALTPQVKTKEPLYKRVWFWLIVVFVGVPLLFVIFGGGVSKTEYDKMVLERDAVIEERDNVISERDSIKAEIDKLKSEKGNLSELNNKLQNRIDDLELICEENGLIVSEDEINKIKEAEAAKSAFEKFQESTESVTYDELIRYPDKYKTIPIKVTVYVKDEDVDKMFGILQGGYLCTISGQKLAVYDNRTVKEPRLRKGDTITIYGYGGGLTKMQRKQKETTIFGLVVDKVVDEWYIPDVRIEYVVTK